MPLEADKGSGAFAVLVCVCVCVCVCVGGYFYSARSYFDRVTRLVIKRVTRHATQRLASDIAMGARRIVCVRRCPALPSLGSCLVLTANGSLRVSNQQECDLP